MSALLDRILVPALGAGLAAAILVAGWQWGAAQKLRVEKAAVVTEFAGYRETLERQTRELLQLRDAKAAVVTKRIQEALDAEHLAHAATKADADRLRESGGQLRRYAADLATSLDRAGAGDPAAAGSSPPAAGTGRVLADMLSRIDDTAAEIAAFADASRRAGQLCERTYEAVGQQPQ